MGYYIPAGYSRVSFDYSGFSTVGSKPSFGFTIDRPPSEEITSTLAAWWDTWMKPYVDSNAVLERVVTRSEVGFYELLVGESGDAGGSFQPPQVSVLVKLATGQAGRNKRGRMYLPFMLLDGDVDSTGAIASITVANTQGILDELVGVLATEEAQLCIGHSTELEPTPVTSVVVQGIAATQRRRLRK